MPLLLLAALTACAQTDTKQNPETDSTPPKERVGPQEEDAAGTVSPGADSMIR